MILGNIYFPKVISRALCSLRRTTTLLLASSLGLAAIPAHAHSFGLMMPSVSAYVLASVPTTSSCFQYTYDTNGNRISSSTSTIVGASAVWGTATFGCATWGQ